MGLIRRESVWSLSSKEKNSKKGVTRQYERTNWAVFHLCTNCSIKHIKELIILLLILNLINGYLQEHRWVATNILDKR